MKLSCFGVVTFYSPWRPRGLPELRQRMLICAAGIGRTSRRSKLWKNPHQKSFISIIAPRARVRYYIFIGLAKNRGICFHACQACNYFAYKKMGGTTNTNGRFIPLTLLGYKHGVSIIWELPTYSLTK